MMGRFLFSILFTFSLLLSVAQESEEQDTLTVARLLTPSIFIDYGKLVTIPLGNETKYEGGVEMLYKEKIPFILEVGGSTLTPDKVYSNGTYEATGQYFRVGTGIYSQWTPKNKMGLTVRYAQSSFEETAELSTELMNNIENTLTEPFTRSNLSAVWFEVVFYSDVKVNDFLALGMNLRFRYLLDYDLKAPIDVYAIPGYGRSFDNSILAPNLFVKVSF